MSSLETVRRATLPYTIAERLRRRIAAGSLRPGERLPGHREPAEQFSVSVGSLRAISMLVAEGLIETRAGSRDVRHRARLDRRDRGVAGDRGSNGRSGRRPDAIAWGEAMTKVVARNRDHVLSLYANPASG